MKRSIGVLALQGSFSKHMETLSSLDIRTVEVREPENLSGIDALVLPGGESTTMSRMLVRWKLIDPIRELIAGGLPVFGTCAGMILLADRLVEWDSLPRIKGLDVTVVRNAYGRQIDSFEAELEIDDKKFNGVFIRAPQIVMGSQGKNVEILSTYEELPVLIRQESILAASFHPELAENAELHAWFIDMIVQ